MSNLNHGEADRPQLRDSLQHSGPVPLKKCLCHGSVQIEDRKETRQLNSVHDPGLDPGSEKNNGVK